VHRPTEPEKETLNSKLKKPVIKRENCDVKAAMKCRL
jgi:hypothetical protein